MHTALEQGRRIADFGEKVRRWRWSGRVAISSFSRRGRGPYCRPTRGKRHGRGSEIVCAGSWLDGRRHAQMSCSAAEPFLCQGRVGGCGLRCEE